MESHIIIALLVLVLVGQYNTYNKLITIRKKLRKPDSIVSETWIKTMQENNVRNMQEMEKGLDLKINTLAESTANAFAGVNELIKEAQQ